jgi:hypothetical protein
LNTTTKTIIINNIIFSDWDEIYENKLVKAKLYIAEKFLLNFNNVKNSDIHKYLDRGFHENTKIFLDDGTYKEISNIKINDVLENGAKVYALVEIDGTQIYDQSIYNLNKKSSFINDTKFHLNNKNLGQILTLQLNDKIYENPIKIYHLVTDKKTIQISNLIFDDYNYCVDFLF